MQPNNLPEPSDFYRFLAGNTDTDLGSYGVPANYEFPTMQSFCSSSFNPWESSGITETPQARALAASKNHKEAEKRRRERINSHLDRLRTLLPCNSKTDKASLLAQVIQRVKELKQESSELIQLDTFPSETDEVTVFSDEDSGDGRLLIKASVCCDDRSDLIPDLIETLKSLRLSPVRAETVTFGGRIRNVMIVAGDDKGDSNEMVQFLKEALGSLVQRSSSDSSDRSKRRRVFDRRIK